MSNVTITLPDGSQRSVPSGTPVREFAASVLPQGVMKKALAAEVGGQLVDLTLPAHGRRAAAHRHGGRAGGARPVPALRRRICSPPP